MPKFSQNKLLSFMEVVLDPYDPSGMFSKAGRASLEMYQMILQKDRILYNKKPAYLPHTNNKLPLDQNIQNLLNSTQKTESTNPAKIIAKPQPFSKMISREILQRMEKNDRRFGMYHPKYHLIFTKSPLYETEQHKETPNKEKNESKLKSVSPVPHKRKTVSCHISNNSRNIEFYDFDIKPTKIKGPTPLKYQLGRDQYPNSLNDVNEKRFESLDLPEIYSKTQKIPSVRLGAILGRSRSNFKKDDCAKGLEYLPKYNLVWPKSSIKIPNLSKMLARKGLELETSGVQSSYISNDESMIKSQGGKTIHKTPDFSKMLAREKTPDENSRLSIQKKNT